MFLADPLVGTLRAPRRLPGEGTRLPLASGRLAVIIQGTRQGSLGLLFQAVLIAMQEEEKSDAEESRQHGSTDPDGSRQPMDVVSQQVAAQSHQASPHDAPKRIEEQKTGPAHLIGPCQEGCPRSQDGDKASEEDHFAAMLEEEILAQLELALIQANIAAIAAQEMVPAFVSDPEPEVIPQDRPAGCRDNHPGNGQLMRGSGSNGRDEQHRFTRKRNARALDRDRAQNGPIAIGGKPWRHVTQKHRSPLFLIV